MLPVAKWSENMSKKELEERESNFRWLMNQNLSSYQGFWVGVVDKSIITKGRNAKDVIKNVRKKFPNKTPFVALIPSEKAIVV